MSRFFRLCAAAALVVAGRPAEAQRSLRWDEIAVTARLDADGRLNVRERQTLVLSGDWNGGERRFRVRPEQSLELRRIRRIDALTGAAIPLRRGSLDAVDAWDWHDAATLRWRSRRPDDPPFRDTRLVYELELVYTNVLQPRGGGEYVLDHDFAFAERPGTIRRFRLDLELDPAWTPRGEVPAGVVASDLAPGRGYVVTLPLRYVGAGSPVGVDAWGPRVSAAARTALLFVPLLVLANAWWRESRLGRFAPLPQVDRGWLERNLAATRPEVLGAAWDEAVGAPEVASVVARLAAEGTLETSVGRRPRRGTPELSLTLKRPLAELEGYERALLAGLFFDGSTRTSASAIRRHYQSNGFDPAALVRPELEKAVEALVGRDRAPRPSWLPGAALFLGGVALAFWGGRPRGDASPLWLLGLFGLILGFGLAHAAAAVFRRRVERGLPAAVPVVLLAALPLGIAWAFLCWGGMPGWRWFTHGGAAAIALSLFVSAVNGARSRRGPDSIRLRKRLCAVRELFRRELRKPRPDLDDAWFPYAVAFGLDKDVERWFSRFAAASQSSASSSSREESLSGAGSTGSSTPSPAPWTGGGGSFGGAGATSTWAAAVGGLAAGVAAPGSSDGGGGGGGGGGGSSGGGGGGGW
jgi:uncharacterized membrane protein YgcG